MSLLFLICLYISFSIFLSYVKDNVKWLDDSMSEIVLEDSVLDIDFWLEYDGLFVVVKIWKLIFN